MSERDGVEARKKRAERGWITDPPPLTPEPLPKAHIDKWARINGATYLLASKDEQ